ncbi:MAG TPA: T9SS type A sorting domain-containing protein [Saprospiraceae bacterium]|nr:T9SS type A sorting domain-containing protein [Saprospiraceae bacterium]
MIRYTILLAFIFSGVCAAAQQMNWTELAEDTVYYANEYLPDALMVTAPGPGQVWDFRSLKAPYALSRRVVVTGERDKVTYANLINGKQTDAVLQILGNNVQLVQVIEDNPICPGGKLIYSLSPSLKPFFEGGLGTSYNYRGKMQTAFAWPRNLNCSWTPAQLPDSCRITYTITLDINVDSDGMLYLPTEVASVFRQHIEEKRILKVETKRGFAWNDVTAQIPALKTISYNEMLRFVSSDTGLEWAEIELKDDYQPVRIEFKTYPMLTRIFSEKPTRADIFAYPNPTFDIVRFQMSDLLYGGYKLKVFNILGVPVKEIDVVVDDPRKTISVDLGDLQRGTYLYRLQDSFGRTVRTKRIVLIQP